MKTASSWTNLEILPRDYGFSAVRGSEADKRKYFIFPSKFAFGGALLKTQKQLESNLAQLVSSLNDGSYTPEFLESDSDTSMLTPENLEQAVKDTEGVYTLWREGGDSVVRNKAFGSILTGEVRSITNGRGSGKGAYRKVAVGSPSAMAQGKFGQLYSRSNDFFWAAPKSSGPMPSPSTQDPQRRGTYTIDNYIAALLTDYMRNMHPTTAGAFLPVNFVDNPLVEMEVLVARYLLDMPLFEIDKRLMNNKKVLNHKLTSGVEDGSLTVEVMQQKRRTPSLDEPILIAEALLRDEIVAWLQKEGFKNKGIYLEFVGTPIETPADAWQKGDTYRSLVLSDKFPPLLVKRTMDSRNPSDFFGEQYTGNLLERIGIQSFYNFDLLRRPATTYIDIPKGVTEPRMAPLRPLYREMLEKNSTIGLDRLMTNYNL